MINALDKKLSKRIDEVEKKLSTHIGSVEENLETHREKRGQVLHFAAGLLPSAAKCKT